LQRAVEPEPAEVVPIRRGRLAAVRAELARKPVTYLLGAGLIVLGPVLAKVIFPEAPTSLAIVGGLIMGVWFAFSGLLNRLMD
jgi:hypothetical protein